MMLYNDHLTEFKSLICLAWPIILTQLFQYTGALIALIFCGYQGQKQLEVVALAFLLINVTGFDVALGLSSACETFYSHVYGQGIKSKDRCIFLQKGLLIITLAVFPCWAIHLNAEKLLVLLGQDEIISRLVGRYMLIFMPGCLCYFIYLNLVKYLQSQDIVYPNLMIGLASTVVNVIAHFVLLTVCELGLDGSAIASVLYCLTLMTLTLLYMKLRSSPDEQWDGWGYAALENWGTFARLGLFGLLMLTIECGTFEIGTLLAGYIGENDLAAQSIIFNLEQTVYMVPLGLSSAVAIRVGQHLGAQENKRAKLSADVGLYFACVVGLTITMLILSTKSFLPHIFTNKPEVIAVTFRMIPFLAWYLVFDNLACVAGGILRGSGRQGLGSLITFVSYAVAISIGIPLMFRTSLRASGFWIGLAIASCMQSSIFMFLVIRTDWEKQVDLANERASNREMEPILARRNNTFCGIVKVRCCQWQTEDHDMSDEDKGKAHKKEQETKRQSVILSRLAVVFLGLLTLLVGLLIRVYVTE